MYPSKESRTRHEVPLLSTLLNIVRLGSSTGLKSGLTVKNCSFVLSMSRNVKIVIYAHYCLVVRDNPHWPIYKADCTGVPLIGPLKGDTTFKVYVSAV